MSSPIDSTLAQSLSWNLKIWTFLGMEVMEDKKRSLVKITLSIIIWVFVIFYYPLSILAWIFKQRNLKDIIETMTMLFTLLVVIIKSIFIIVKMQNIRQLLKISRDFDTTVVKPSEKQILKDYLSYNRKYFNFFGFCFCGCLIPGGISMFFYKNKRPQYPAYFPYDWKKDNAIYIATLLFQYCSWCTTAIFNLTYDTYPPMLMDLVSRYLEILCSRTEKIGINPEISQKDSEFLLKKCIYHHRYILKFYRLTQDTISIPMFCQLLITALNLVNLITLMIFFSESIFQTISYVFIAMVYILQIVMSCYYGSVFETYIEKQRQSVYFCNWYEQSHSFKRSLIIFAEYSIRDHSFIAGGLLILSLNTFLRIMRNTFSLMSVFNNLKHQFV
ncbi:Or59a family protein [Megaselia abdita]